MPQGNTKLLVTTAVSLALATQAYAANAPASPTFNDTGVITLGYNSGGTAVPCEKATPANDCNTGRDASGKKAFNFVKLDKAGKPLPDNSGNADCIRDQVSGLYWERKTRDGSLRDAAKLYTYHIDDKAAGYGAATDAAGYIKAINTQGVCGFNDWRMPTLRELIGLIDFGTRTDWRTDTAIDTRFFAETSPGLYIASDVSARNLAYVWGIRFSNGGTDVNLDHNVAGSIRLVRSDSKSVPFSASTTGDEVIDEAAGIIWRRCAEGLRWNGETCSGRVKNYTLAQAFSQASKEASRTSQTWRLPNVKELQSLLDLSVANGTLIDPALFPATPARGFWSSTPYAGSESYAWYIGFDDGKVYYASIRSAELPVRLVRSIAP